MSAVPTSVAFGRIRCHVEPDGRVRRISLDGNPDPGAGWVHVDALVEFGDLVAVDGGPERFGATTYFVNVLSPALLAA